MTPDTTLPVPLPEPRDYGYRDEGGTWNQQMAYSTDQMQSYARACMAPLQERADALQAERASLADTVAEAVRNTCSLPHPDISLSTDLKPHIWSLSFEANAQKARADALEEALREIMNTHIPDMPMAWNDEAGWNARQHANLRGIARRALINPTGGES